MGASISNGSTLGRYRVVSPLGEGGMGEVYLARDTQLERQVALKILPPDLAAHGERMRRFRQEARAAAALNHPAIAHVYEIGESDGVNFIALEYVEGETLNAVIHRERAELPRLLKYLSEVADGLAKAHAEGVVHRDLKPDNVMISRDGYAKILDFGLAKLVEPALWPDGGDPNEAATAMMRPHSTPGVVMGTVGYMSPEQAQGRVAEIDHRSDIFSFGCLLYEAATGHRPFEGDSLIKSLHKLVYEPAPPIAEFNPQAPPELQRIVRRCLAKDPEERYQSIKDMAIELRELRRELDEGAGTERTVASDAGRPTGVGEATLILTDAERAARTNDAGAGTNASGAGGAAVSRAGQPSAFASEAGGSRGVVSSPRRAIWIGATLVILIALVAGGAYLYRARGGDAIDSVAVLPLANVTNDPTADWLADGITESVIYKLSQISNLKVIARSTVFRYKGREVDPAQAARELGVRAVLTGRFIQRGDTLTVSAELVDAREGRLLWGERYERTVADANAIQQEIARAASDHLRPKMSGDERAQMAKTGTANPEAYQLYLKGRFYWNKRTVDDLKKSVDFFQQAVALDPNYALAYAGLADAYEVLPSYSDLPPEETYLKSKPAAQKAVELDPTLAEPHAALGGVMSEYERNFAGAEAEFRRAIELNPNYATAHQWYGEHLENMGRFEEAVAEMQRARDLDPQSPIINTMMGDAYSTARRDEEALAQFRRTLDIDPNFPRAHERLGWLYLYGGRYEEGIDELRKSALLFGEPREDVERRAGELKKAYVASGARAFWQQLAAQGKGKDELTAAPYERIVVAVAYAQLGDKDRAFAVLGQMCDGRDPGAVLLKAERGLDPLRSDPRYAALVRRLGLAQ